MIWKPKEKPLTKEEVIKVATEKNKKYWYNSTPLFYGTNDEENYFIYPLTTDFGEYAWLFYFFDVCSTAGVQALQYTNYLQKRYKKYNLNIIGIIKKTYPFLINESSIIKCINENNCNHAVFFDHDNSAHEAYCVTSKDTMVLSKGGKVVFKEENVFHPFLIENKIQNFLRSSDPGLPLPPEYNELPKKPSDTQLIQINSKDSEVSITPSAIKNDSHIIIKQENTVVTFNLNNKSLSIILDINKTEEDCPKINLEINGKPLFERNFGRNVKYDYDGAAIIQTTAGGLYHVVDNNNKESSVTLKFVGVSKNPVTLYQALID